MIPIQEPLNRIHWGPDFGRGEFIIGYYDRIEDDIIKVPPRELYFNPEDHFSFRLLDTAGKCTPCRFTASKCSIETVN